MNVLLLEHEAFAHATDGLQQTIDALHVIAQHRPDQREKWLKMAEVLTVSKEGIWRLAGTGVRQ